jgi:uncharacterized membrane protein (UPF0136 family)
MCAQKMQRFLMAIVLSVATYLMSQGSMIGFILQAFVIGMILVWAVIDFCPSLFVFDKLFGNCDKTRDK